MTYDFATERVCPHVVVRETAVVDEVSRMVVRFQRPPTGSSVILYVNGASVPPGGLFSRAEVGTTSSEPFRVTSGQDDLIYVGVPGSAPRIVQLLAGHTVSARDMARDLSLKLPELSVTAENKRVVFRSRAPGPGRLFQFPDPRWTDKTSSLPSTARILGGFTRMGIIPGRAGSGKRLFPSWSLTADPFSTIETDRIIQLSDPLPQDNPVVKLTYATAPASCRRCFGSRIEFDYGVVNGTYETVEGANLLAQELDKFLFTKIGSHWKWPWLGSQLVNRIGGKGGGTGALNSMISLDVSRAFSTYQNIKAQQAQSQNVTDAEFPGSLDDLSVVSDKNDPTVSVVTASVTTRNLQSFDLGRIVGDPNPFSVLGQNPSQILRLGSSFRRRG
ncbi:MAG: hypothetical protein BWY99_02378 [Synergistetes bacterium ADurb.BinA166]|nr:MAG: hypothetical protein BWY99_02378 [Synergistetes bacterium ADurb.BinA166]